MDFSALFAVRDAPGCRRPVIALPQQGTHPFGICVLLTSAHVRDESTSLSFVQAEELLVGGRYGLVSGLGG